MTQHFHLISSIRGPPVFHRLSSKSTSMCLLTAQPAVCLSITASTHAYCCTDHISVPCSHPCFQGLTPVVPTPSPPGVWAFLINSSELIQRSKKGESHIAALHRRPQHLTTIKRLVSMKGWFASWQLQWRERSPLPPPAPHYACTEQYQQTTHISIEVWTIWSHDVKENKTCDMLQNVQMFRSICRCKGHILCRCAVH